MRRHHDMERNKKQGHIKCCSLCTKGAITLGLAHGFVSSGLFICAGGILYDRSSTRLITFYRGIAQVMPLFSVLFLHFVPSIIRLQQEVKRDFKQARAEILSTLAQERYGDSNTTYH
jgi:hypothetical protein